MKKTPLTYRQAGVDIDKANATLAAIGAFAKRTYHPQVLAGIGGFGACYELPTAGYDQPVLVSATDGVGTKLKLALQLNRHEGIGIDLVAMSVNDLITLGAKPLYFLDYYATGQLNADHLTTIVQSISEGCLQADCALIGGETAEMPGVYQAQDYDLAGFCVGIVNKPDLITRERVQPGDRCLALASSGPHANGYSLIRKILERCNTPLTAPLPTDVAPSNPDAQRLSQAGQRSTTSIKKPTCSSKTAPSSPTSITSHNVSATASTTHPIVTIADQLLAPTRIYVRAIRQLLATVPVQGIAHITGGGLIENLPRVLPQNCCAQLEMNWHIPDIFQWLQAEGQVPDDDIWRTFNMGVGMVVIVPRHAEADAIAALTESGETVWPIGEIVQRPDEQTPSVTLAHP